LRRKEGNERGDIRLPVQDHGVYIWVFLEKDRKNHQPQYQGNEGVGDDIKLHSVKHDYCCAKRDGESGLRETGKKGRGVN
jgi:hypothetical protein